jgi:AraC-like DNA-binding protein
MGYQVRSQVLTGYATLARAHGLAPELLAKGAGLDLSALADLDGRISAKAFANLLEASASAARAEAFGLLLAESRGIGILGPVGLLMREQSDVRSALLTLARYLPIHNEALELRLAEERGMAILTLNVLLYGMVEVRHFTELSLGAFFRIMSRFLGPQWKPSRVCFDHRPPADLSIHKRFFGCRVEFEHDFNGIVFASRDLDATITLSDTMLARYAHRYLESLAQRNSASPGEKVRELIRIWLPSGNCSADTIARGLGVDRRSVHRYLSEAGDSFSSVTNEVRADLAARLLSGGKPLSEIAELVGFSGSAAFSRWFRQAFGCSPSEWRESAENLRPDYRNRKRLRARRKSN